MRNRGTVLEEAAGAEVEAAAVAEPGAEQGRGTGTGHIGWGG